MASLNLDARQRAMLEEMGVRVWLPEEEVAIEKNAQQPAEPRIPQKPVAVAAAEPAPRRAAEPEVALARAATPIGDRAAAIAQMDWPALQAAVSGCRACDLCESRHNTVFGIGQSGAPIDWLIVGEAPGENEDIRGEPFVGAAGRLLDNMLRAVGLDRHAEGPSRQRTVFISNVLKCRPPGNRNPLPHETAQCTPYLARQIELLKPRLILALGRFAAQALLQPSIPDVDKRPLGKLRGQIHRYRGVPVVVSYHPAYLLRNLPDKAKGWADLVLALQVLQSTPARVP